MRQLFRVSCACTSFFAFFCACANFCTFITYVAGTYTYQQLSFPRFAQPQHEIVPHLVQQNICAVIHNDFALPALQITSAHAHRAINCTAHAPISALTRTSQGFLLNMRNVCLWPCLDIKTTSTWRQCNSVLFPEIPVSAGLGFSVNLYLW